MATILCTLNVLNQLEKSWLFQIKLHSHDRIPKKYFQLNPGLSLALKLWDKTVVISVVPNAYKQGLCSAASSVEMIFLLKWSFLIPQMCMCWVSAKLRPVRYSGCFTRTFYFRTLEQHKYFLPFLITEPALSKKNQNRVLV